MLFLTVLRALLQGNAETPETLTLRVLEVGCGVGNTALPLLKVRQCRLSRSYSLGPALRSVLRALVETCRSPANEARLIRPAG